MTMPSSRGRDMVASLVMPVRLERRLPAARAGRARSGSACARPATEVPERALTRSARRCSRRARARSARSPHAGRRAARGPRRGARRVPAHGLGRVGAAGLPDCPSDRVVPVRLRARGADGGRRPPCRPPSGRGPGCFAYDTMTLIGPGTWEAARAAVDVALTAVDLVADGAPLRVRVLPAARPSRDAVALRRLVLPEQLRGRGGGAARPRRRRRSRCVDIDAHHGNGTQEIFCGARRRARRRRSTSIPGAGWFPHFLGFAAESDDGANLNVPARARLGRRGVARRGARSWPRSPRGARGARRRRSASTPRPPIPRARSR